MAAHRYSKRHLASVSALSFGSVCALALLATPVAHQDVAGLIALKKSVARWQSVLVAAPQGSIHQASFRFGEKPSLASLGTKISLGGEDRLVALKGIEAVRRHEGAAPGSNRSSRGDLLMTRQHDVEDDQPNAGQIYAVPDLYSPLKGSQMPRLALMAPDVRDGREIMAAARRLGDASGSDEPAHLMMAYDRSAPLPNRRKALIAAKEKGFAGEAMLSAYMGTARLSGAPFEELLREIKPAPLPRPQPIVFKMPEIPEDDFAWAKRALPRDTMTIKQQRCLAQAIYFEARSEPRDGQVAVAQVVLNRVKNPAFPDSICGVVFHNEKKRNACQFSFACDGKPEDVRSQKAWGKAKQIAREVTMGETWIARVGSSTHYHADYVAPRWAKKLRKVKTIGRHIFYKTRYGGWS